MDTDRVFHHFFNISKIPRGSGNEQEISNYLVNFAKEHKLYVLQDEYNNVLIRKNATKGYEKYKSICLQGHMDMVCEKEEGKVFDFKKDPIEILIENGYIKANKTSLGADNGISLAICLAILESEKIAHPELEILLTTDEEVGMKGAKGFDISKLKSKILVNIDSEEYGSIYVSSAGSSIATSKKEFNMILNKNENIYRLNIQGLIGGHSGVDIHLNTANANIVLAELLLKLSNVAGINIIEFVGGTKNNTIPRTSMAIFSSKLEKLEIEKLLNLFFDAIAYRYSNIEKSIKYSIEKIDGSYPMLSYEDSKLILEYIYNMPNGVLKMSTPILVESSANMGIVNTKNTNNSCLVCVKSSIRSLKIKYQDYIAKYIESYSKNFGFSTIVEKAYNPWEYKEKSEIRDHFASIFEKLTGVKPKIMKMHAGLETGLFAEKNQNLDIISIGPDIKNPHTPYERMSVEAVINIYKYLIKALEEFKIER